MALEPIFEVEFHDSSYGFRPNRSTHHAVARCRQMALTGFTWVIEGDVKACFDEISHKAILRCLREKVMDNKFLALIQLPVEGGRGDRRRRSSDHERGSTGWRGLTAPGQHRAEQIGLVSPFQGVPRQCGDANGGVHGLPNVRFARYADDWCVFLTRCIQAVCGAATGRDPRLPSGNLRARTVGRKDPDNPRERRVRLSRIQHLDRCWQSREVVPKIKVGRKAITNIQRRLGEALRYRPMQESISVRLSVLRQSFVAGRTTSRSPTTSHKLPMGWTTRLSGSR